jgi:hypothetical protein
MSEGEFSPESPEHAVVEMLRELGSEVLSVSCVRRPGGGFDCEAQLADGASWEGIIFAASLERPTG